MLHLPTPQQLRPGLVLALLVGMLGGCEVSARKLDYPALGMTHGEVDLDAAVPIPDGATACEVDEDCVDDVGCTVGRCVKATYCIHTSDPSLCDDGVFCNGAEVCDPARGCRDVPARTCSDGDTCTVDRCDEAGKQCLNEPRDFDGDGEVDWHCFGGTDCDDLDATRANAVSEICYDGVDNDCDNLIDETESCDRPKFDTCGDALDVGGGGSYLVSLAGAAPDYGQSCATGSARDVIFTFELSKPRDVMMRARGLYADGGEESAVIALRSDCNDIFSEVECGRGFPAQVRLRALPAGRYFAVVTSVQSGEVVFEVDFDDASDAPTNTECSGALDVGQGGRFYGDLVDVSDSQRIPCGYGEAGDVTYRFSLPTTRDVELTAISETGESMNFAVRRECDDPASTLRCVSDAPARARLHQLPAGDYSVILEGPTSREVDFTLDVAFLEPSAPPEGDGCANPISLSVGETHSGSLVGRQDMVDLVCGCVDPDPLVPCGLFHREAVYELQVTQHSDLNIEIDGGSSRIDYALQSSCGESMGQRACGAGTPLRSRVRDVEPGTYYLVVESPVETSYSLSVETLPLSKPVPVSDNDRCGTAVQVGPSGGLYRGSTISLLADYAASCGANAGSEDAVFLLDLPGFKNVRAQLTSTFDTVLHVFEDDGSGPGGCQGYVDVACDDDGGSGNDSLLDLNLAAGRYYLIVDGYAERNAGQYTLDIAIREP